MSFKLFLFFWRNHMFSLFCSIDVSFGRILWQTSKSCVLRQSKSAWLWNIFPSFFEESISFHFFASLILVLVKYCGKPRNSVFFVKVNQRDFEIFPFFFLTKTYVLTSLILCCAQIVPFFRDHVTLDNMDSVQLQNLCQFLNLTSIW